MMPASILSVSPEAYREFWTDSDELPSFGLQGPIDRALRARSSDGEVVQYWDTETLRRLDAPANVVALLTTYGLPLWVSGRIGALPEALELPFFQPPGRNSPSTYRLLGRAGHNICFDVEKEWAVFSLDDQGERLLPVSSHLALMMEAMLVWERHRRKQVLRPLRWSDLDDALAAEMIDELRCDLMAVGAISDAPIGDEPFENFWADCLAWLRVDMLGE